MGTSVLLGIGVLESAKLTPRSLTVSIVIQYVRRQRFLIRKFRRLNIGILKLSFITVILSAITLFVPVFSGYILGLGMLIITLFSRIVGEPANSSDEHKKFLNLLKPISNAAFFFVASLIVAGFWAAVDSEVTQSNLLKRSLANGFVKYLLLWMIYLTFWWRGTAYKKILPFFAFSFAVISVFHLAYCIAQRAYGLDWGHGLHAVLGPGRYAYGVYRVSGFLGHPLTLGYSQLLAICGCAAFYTITDSRQEKNTWLVGLLSALVLILISGSRGPQILAVALVLMFIPRQMILERWRILSFISVILAVFVVSIGTFSRFHELFNNGFGGDARLTHWSVYWHIFNDHRLHGIGPGAPEQAISAYYFKAGADDTIKLAHNAFLQCAAEYGVLGLTGMLFWISSWARLGLSVHYVRKGIFGLLFILVCGGLVQNTIQDSEFVLSLTVWTMLLVAKEVNLSGIAAGRAKTKNIVT